MVAGEIVVKNVVINGSDSAQSRGQIGACYTISSEGVDFHTLTKSGRYWFTNAAIAASTNAPPTQRGGFCDVLGNEDANAYTKQIYHVYNSPIIYVTEHTGAEGGWSEKWTKIINGTDLATSSTPGIVKPGTGMTVDASGALNVSLNNTVTSTSTTQVATANAVKTAYDKGVDAQKSANSASAAATAAQTTADDALEAAQAATSSSGKVSLKGTRSTQGSWTITDLTIGKPLFILMTADPEDGGYSYVFIEAVSGTNDGLMISTGNVVVSMFLGAGSSYRSSNTFVVIPTQTTVVISLGQVYGSASLRAYQ